MPSSDLEPEARRQVLETVLTYPALRLAEIARHTGLAPNLVDYHLEALLDAELVVEATFEGHRRFYPLPVPGAPGVADAEWLAVLREPVRLQVALRLVQESPATHTALAEEAGVSKSTLSHHLGRLVEVGLLQRGERGAYEPSDRGRLLRLLVAHRPHPAHFGKQFGRWLALYREAASP